MTALKLGLNLSCFASRHCRNLSLWLSTFDSLLTKLNTACPWQRRMNPFRLNPTAVLWQRCRPLWLWHLFPMGSDPCIIYICRNQIQRLLLVRLSYLSIASVPLLMDCPTPIYSMADLGLHFVRMVTHMSVPLCYLNSRHALD